MDHSQDEIIAFLVKNLTQSQLWDFVNAVPKDALRVVSEIVKGPGLMLLIHSTGNVDVNDVIESVQKYLNTRQNREPYDFLCEQLVERHGKAFAEHFSKTHHPWDLLLERNDPKKIGPMIAEWLLEKVDIRKWQTVEEIRIRTGTIDKGGKV